MPTKNYADAMLDVLTTFMEEDPNFVVMGNEVLGIGPEAMQFEPFQEQYGTASYFPPCSEAAYSALAAGAAMCGQRMFLTSGSRRSPTRRSPRSPARSRPRDRARAARSAVPVTLHISHGLLHGGASQHRESPMGMYWNLPASRSPALGARRPQGPADDGDQATTRRS